MKTYLKVALISLGAIAIVAGALVATSQSSFCIRCHEMTNNYISWQASTHAEAACVDCHIGPGAVNYVVHKFQALQEVGSHITGSYETPINKGSVLSKTLPSKNCTGCHKNIKDTPSETLKFNHEEHRETNTGCAYCHNRTAHPNLKAYSNRINMPFCVNCHKQKKASVACNLCHPASLNLKPASHEQANFIKAHGKEDVSKCDYCHMNEKAFCDKCHGLAMPHQANWKTTHAETKLPQSVCGNCHDIRVFCDKCHHPGFDPTKGSFIRAHPSIVRQQGNSACRACHPETFCNNCHKNLNPHPANWISRHEGAANSSCYNCHARKFCSDCHARSED